MNRVLPVFVYGTLMRGFDNHERRVAPYPHDVRPARAEGTLYHLPEGYPAVVADEAEPAGSGWVQGELLWFPEDRYEEVLAGLDELEDYFGPGDPRNLYEREEVRVVAEDTGEAVLAYMYRMRGGQAARAKTVGTLVADGNWRRFVLHGGG